MKKKITKDNKDAVNKTMTKIEAQPNDTDTDTNPNTDIDTDFSDNNINSTNSNATNQNRGPGFGRGGGPGGSGGPGGPGGHMGAPTEKAKDFKGTIKRLITVLRPYKWSLLVVLAFVVASTVLAIAGPKILGQATNQIVYD